MNNPLAHFPPLVSRPSAKLCNLSVLAYAQGFTNFLYRVPAGQTVADALHADYWPDDPRVPAKFATVVGYSTSMFNDGDLITFSSRDSVVQAAVFRSGDNVVFVPMHQANRPEGV